MNNSLFGGWVAHVFYISALVALGMYVESRWHCLSSRGDVQHAIAVVRPTKNNSVEGIVTFQQEPAGVRVKAELRNLTPGKHGFHIHAYGDNSCDDGMCTGDHFNPTKSKHGSLTSAERHVGDFGNLEADASGVARMEFVDKGLALHGPHSIIGRAVIVHADADDLVSQPSGNAGARIGCGVIGIGS